MAKLTTQRSVSMSVNPCELSLFTLLQNQLTSRDKACKVTSWVKRKSNKPFWQRYALIFVFFMSDRLGYLPWMLVG